MKNNINGRTSNNGKNSNRFLPNSLKFISSCIKTASSGVRSASATVAASISCDNQNLKDKVLWSSFDRLEVGSSLVKQVLLIGYDNGFQVIDVEDASDVSEVVSRRDDPVTFLQIQPFPIKTEDREGFIASHPILLVVACDESKSPDLMHGGREGLVRDGHSELHAANESISPTVVRFYSLKSHIYVHNLRFRSTVYMVRCSPRIVAVGLAAQIHCFDAVTLENKLSVLTYPVPQLGTPGYNVGYGPMAVGSRWLAYTCNSPLQSNTSRLSPQSLTPSPGVSPSTSPGNGSLVARYAMESSKQLATGLLSLGDKGYRTFSKYYQDFVPDAGSPVSPNSVWKGGRGASHLAENDVAGMVVVKDFLSRSVIAQLKAHTSPISALCFDPSGTLLVTASVYGNNINVFRIMPSYSQNGSSNRSYDWTSSHVHLYKLHRGMTSAVIQDICFSHCSRWIGVTSSRGTCHIFAFSPFGGENILQIQNSDVVEPTISPVQPLPWWFTPYFVEKHFISSPPPPSVTLSVASRIKSNSLGWLNSVGTASSSVSGKASIPSGAVAAVFHSCVRHDMEPAHLKGVTGLEHLLVYTSSGHVVQYKLLSAIRGEPNEPSSRNLQGSSGQMQDEDLGVRVEAVQWWDVCRRVDWPERNECILGRKEAAESGVDVSDCADESFVHKDVKSHEKSHLYLSNAEVNVSSGRVPVWLNSKMHFYTMNPLPVDKLNILEDQSGIESEVEKLPVSEVEIRQKDLLPVLDHYHQVQSGWNSRGFIGERHLIASLGSHIERGKLYGGPVFQSNTPSAGSIVNSDGGSPMSCYKPVQQPWNVMNNAEKYNLTDKLLGGLTSGLLSEGRNIRKDGQLSNSSGGTSDVSNISSNRSDLSMNVIDEGPVNESPEFEQYFQEEYCKASSPSSEYHGSTGAVTDVDNNIDKSVEEDDNYEMLGGVFDFSEEG